ncbi:MAG: nucleoside kinase, partial [Calditrichales bacterium]
FTVNSHIGKTRKLFQIYQESKNWGKILGVSDVGRLDQIIAKGGISEIIKVAESLHEKKIARIADTITARKEDLRLVLIAGPSASGKTTFSKRLSTQLQVNGIRPLALSMDNYFVDRQSCPRDGSGELDFEALGAIDLDLFNRHLADLLEGREVAVPKFNFEIGRRESEHHNLWLEDDQILVVEGIHALNPKISAAVPERNKFRIYVSALTQLTINDHSRISTTDTRILRRLVRDNSFRNYDTAQTLKRFPSVIRGERRNTFPFQESADVMFNSALVYELAVLKDLALPLLEMITADDETYTEARRLLMFLMLFQPVAADEVPPTSILREFIGGSSFRY